jgi:hypothetical protein
MLTLRPEQLETIRQYHLQKFEDEMVVHLQKFASQHWKVMGEPAGREVIKLGIAQAAHYGFTMRGSVRFYIELMFLFGSFFDTDPQHPWAIKVLSDPRDLHEDFRASKLHTSMKNYLDQVVTPERKHLRAAIEPLLNARYEEVMPSGTDLEHELLRLLHNVCPARCEYVGDHVLERMIRHGFALAKRQGYESEKGRSLMVILGFVVGHRFPEDPLNPWILRRLRNPRWPDPNKQVDELAAKSLLYLKHILAASESA